MLMLVRLAPASLLLLLSSVLGVVVVLEVTLVRFLLLALIVTSVGAWVLMGGVVSVVTAGRGPARCPVVAEAVAAATSPPLSTVPRSSPLLLSSRFPDGAGASCSRRSSILDGRGADGQQHPPAEIEEESVAPGLG